MFRRRLDPGRVWLFVARLLSPQWVPVERDRNDLFIRHVFMDELPASVFENPLRDSEAVMRIPASKSILPKLFESEQPPIRKADYYRIAECMEPEDIHPEVIEVLDRIAGLMPEDVSTT